MSTEVKYNPVYNSELAVITEGHRQLNKLNQSMAELRDEYRTLLNQYERLFKSSRKISAISDVQGNMLKQRENDIQNLLDHANQGFLTVGPNLRVNKSYSRECVRIFGRKIGGADITELLWGG
ncbi:hypothetical protein K0U00_40535, partial [Paenibacillus sepulcri]|nr:hypothetical protein [Paenibacillus sepulcri]